jgi:hypothetical protein
MATPLTGKPYPSNALPVAFGFLFYREPKYPTILHLSFAIDFFVPV